MIRTRIFNDNERRIIVDALRRAASETRTTRAAIDSAPGRLDSVAARAHYELLVALEDDQTHLATEIADKRDELRLERRGRR